MKALRRVTFVVMSLLLWQAASAPAADRLSQVIEEAREHCRSFEEGVFSMPEEAVTRLELASEEGPETLVDFRRFRCSSAASLYCGTGGCPIVVIVGDSRTDFLAKDWKLVEWAGRRILLFAVHGANCGGGTNLRDCFEAVVWSDGAFQSVR